MARGTGQGAAASAYSHRVDGSGGSQATDHLRGGARLIIGLLYGAGLRQIECLSLRVKDLDFAYRQVVVRDGKGGKDRVTMLPENLVQPLQAHLGKVRALHQRDLKEGFGDVWLPHALARIRVPGASGDGNSYFRLQIGRRSRRPARFAVTTCIRIRWHAC